MREVKNKTESHGEGGRPILHRKMREAFLRSDISAETRTRGRKKPHEV